MIENAVRTIDRSEIFRIIALGVLLLMGLSCAVNPVTGRQEFSLVSEQQEIEIGRQTDPDILEKYGYYSDPALQAYVRSIGEPLARLSHRPSLAYHFKVVDSHSINAFALPGGYVYITRGILAYLNSEAELANVLGHEIGHVTERHAVQQLSAAFGLQITSLILSSSVKGSDQFSQLTDVLFTGILNGYGRSKEFSSDRLGQDYMLREGYDPSAAVNVLTTLQRTGGDPLDPVTHWLVSSHPYASERVQRASAYAQELDPQKQMRKRDRERYFAQIDGIVFGPGEREGILEDHQYRNRYFQIACIIPHGWQVQTGRDQWASKASEQGLQMQFRMEEFQNTMNPDAFAADVEKGMGLEHGEFLFRRKQKGIEVLAVQYRASANSTPVVVLGGYFLYKRKGIAFHGFARDAQADQLSREWRKVLDSVRLLSTTEAASIPVTRIRIHTVRPGETLQSLAGRYLGNPAKAKKIAEINGMDPGTRLIPGIPIKVIANQ